MPRTESRTKTKAKTETGTKAGVGARPVAKATAKAHAKATAGRCSEGGGKGPRERGARGEEGDSGQVPRDEGVRPSVVRRKVPAERDVLDLIGQIDGELGARLASAKGRASMRELYCASFEKETKTERGTVIRRIVRVTFDRDGHILKLVSSK